MKKLLLKVWDILNIIYRKIKEIFFMIYDFFYKKTHKPPKVITISETVKYILDNRCSVARFGDGEIKLIAGRNLFFQKNSYEISQSLKDSLSSERTDVLVCIPDIFTDEALMQYNPKASKHWKQHLSFFRKYWYKNTHTDRIYGNAFLSRPYNNYKDKSHCKEYFEYLRTVWNDREIVIAEGEKSRLGMGNDLFDNAKSVERILCPSISCFEKADEIINEVSKCAKSKLILLALGPTASVVPYKLTDLGYQAMDIGNIDTEYEWFLSGATEKQPIKDKLVYEANSIEIGNATDEKYLSQIISRVI